MNTEKIINLSNRQFKRLYKNIDGKMVRKHILGICQKPVSDTFLITNKSGSLVKLKYKNGTLKESAKLDSNNFELFTKQFAKLKNGGLSVRRIADGARNSKGDTWFTKLFIFKNEKGTRTIQNFVSDIECDDGWYLGKKGQVITDVLKDGKVIKKEYKPSARNQEFFTESLSKPVDGIRECFIH